jgi:ubiquitin thioesterase protein OTUB1
MPALFIQWFLLLSAICLIMGVSLMPSYPTDEQIVKQRERIEELEVNSQPIVSDPFPLESLEVEYEGGDSAFLEKIKCLKRVFSRYRKCRGDGNCFFRAFSFRLIELIRASQDGDLLTKLFARIKSWLDLAGFQADAYMNFLEMSQVNIADFLEKAPIIEAAGEDPSDWLAQEWRRDAYASNSMIVLLRLLASAFLRTNAEAYLPFIWEVMATEGDEGPDKMMAAYCQQFVESFGQESDQIHIIALTKAIGCRIEVAYLDASTPPPNLEADDDDCSALFLKFGEVEESNLIEAPITTLYRPGHYDIIYLKSADAAS